LTPELWRKAASKVEDKLATWRLNVMHAAEDAGKALRRRRS
jgi:hypothetical protein